MPCPVALHSPGPASLTTSLTTSLPSPQSRQTAEDRRESCSVPRLASPPPPARNSCALRGLPCSPRAQPSSPSSGSFCVTWLHSVVPKTHTKPCVSKQTEDGACGPAAPRSDPGGSGQRDPGSYPQLCLLSVLSVFLPFAVAHEFTGSKEHWTEAKARHLQEKIRAKHKISDVLLLKITVESFPLFRCYLKAHE